jgi:hypothetical protein
MHRMARAPDCCDNDWAGGRSGGGRYCGSPGILEISRRVYEVIGEMVARESAGWAMYALFGALQKHCMPSGPASSESCGVLIGVAQKDTGLSRSFSRSLTSPHPPGPTTPPTLFQHNIVVICCTYTHLHTLTHTHLVLWGSRSDPPRNALPSGRHRPAPQRRPGRVFRGRCDTGGRPKSGTAPRYPHSASPPLYI